MRRIAFLFLLFPFALSAQEESCTVLGVQELSQLYQDLLDAHAELQEQFALLRGVQETTDNGDGTITFTFTDGTTFTTGDLTGPAGADGQDGADGADGICIASTVDNGDGTITFNYTNGTSFTTGDLTGPAGVGVDSVVDNGDGTITITLTDGSSTVTTLVIYGCTDSNFTEYNPEAMVDNGTCFTPVVLGCLDSGFTEYNAAANTDDGSCATPVVLGCTDAQYIEFDPLANTDDGSCSTPVVLGCTASNNALYNPQANTDDGSCSATCVDVAMDGYTYDVVLIGSQCWFSENLRATVYTDGSSIPEVTSNSAWLGLSSGARCNYDNNAGNVAAYGRLYNWYAVDDARGLCPSGWHVPTDEEWTELEGFITSQGFAGTEGTRLKSTTGWSNNSGTNNFGFSALPGGFRLIFLGTFSNAGSVGWWWSSSPGGSGAWYRRLDASLPKIYSNDYGVSGGLSVRCLGDAD